MDFGWFDRADGTLWLVELTGYEHLPPVERLPSYQVDMLVDKARDVLLMLSAIWLGTAPGAKLRAELPAACRPRPSQLKLCFVLKVDGTPDRMRELRLLRDQFRAKTKVRAGLLGASVTLTDHLTAGRFLPLT